MIEFYLPVKIIHVTSASFSIILFAIRGYRRLFGRTMWFTNWLTKLPHAIDTLLLLTGILLIIITNQYPSFGNWITIKLFAVVVYILLGMAALKWTRSTKWSALSFVAALSVFASIVVLVLNRNTINL